MNILNWFTQGWSRAQHHPAAPEGLTVFAVGDIHGRSDLLSAAHERIDEEIARIPQRQTVEVYLGDYVDRGPDSAGVVELLVARSTVRNTVFIRGNHELLLSEYFEGKITIDTWKPLGGVETLLSYGVSHKNLSNERVDHSALAQFQEIMPAAHHMFFRSLRPYYVIGDYLFVHAGVKPGVELQDQSEQKMMWIRDEFLNYKGDFGYIVVHGHTPVQQPEILANRINIDTGAFATNMLTCLRIDDEGPSILEMH